ncbi:MAG: hypothetical protein HY905_15950 [Deltaproteobacteria bacterium]|nr:hypothetical protein [Deltaproteobacteria bacterium]
MGVRSAAGAGRACVLAVLFGGGLWNCDTGTRLAGDDRDDTGGEDRTGADDAGEDGNADVAGEGADVSGPDADGASDGTDGLDTAEGFDGDPTDGPSEERTCGAGRTWCAGECVDLANDPDHCGDCDGRCRFRFADGRCDGGVCGLGDCWGGHWDVDGEAANGCEYVCGGSRPELRDETCNDLDDDCDGDTDEGVVGVGEPCGTTEGSCEPGVTACADGEPACAGGVAPAPETCNGLDDDCDGETDEETGLERCGNGLDDDCDGATDELPPTGPEVCNACDDDGDGATDEDLGAGGWCGPEAGECDPGHFACVGGEVACVGGRGPARETCDCRDNDCDGETDEGELCGGGEWCVECICAVRCDPELEFPCPVGWECTWVDWPEDPGVCFCMPVHG